MREIISRERINDSLTDITFELIKSSIILWSFFFLMILQHSGCGYKVISEKTKIKFMHRGDKKLLFDNAPQIDLILQWPLMRRRVRPL